MFRCPLQVNTKLLMLMEYFSLLLNCDGIIWKVAKLGLSWNHSLLINGKITVQWSINTILYSTFLHNLFCHWNLTWEIIMGTTLCKMKDLIHFSISVNYTVEFPAANSTLSSFWIIIYPIHNIDPFSRHTILPIWYFPVFYWGHSSSYLEMLGRMSQIENVSGMAGYTFLCFIRLSHTYAMEKSAGMKIHQTGRYCSIFLLLISNLHYKAISLWLGSVRRNIFAVISTTATASNAEFGFCKTFECNISGYLCLTNVLDSNSLKG